jgi:hypothetical protein
LSLSLRVFGIRFSIWQHSYDLWESDDLLNLYIVQGAEIHKVIDSLVVRAQLSSNGCDKGGETYSATCNRTEDEIKRTLADAKTSHHGFADIVLSEAKRQCMEGATKKESCGVSKFNKAKFIKRVEFDGNHYEIPSELRNGMMLQW